MRAPRAGLHTEYDGKTNILATPGVQYVLLVLAVLTALGCRHVDY